ncbi:hypothetical protein [Pandoraea sp. NPDC087047]|uniref:hypothetical protein n=1 Tax=Pandoraea sp. NPDC087047 TaxID=3364390 RepID=UPI0037FAA695
MFDLLDDARAASEEAETWRGGSLNEKGSGEGRALIGSFGQILKERDVVDTSSNPEKRQSSGFVDIEVEEICRRITVQPPYFAFKRLRENTLGEIYGEFIVEQPLGSETGPVTAAEIGRHLAILGSCAAAQIDHHLTYYLATHASYIRLREPLIKTHGELLQANARVVRFNHRSLEVDSYVSDGAPFARLTVRYQCLRESLFNRMFEGFRHHPIAVPEASPYVRPVPLSFDTPSATRLVAHSRQLSVNEFAGHFPNYPAWPVAILASCSLRVVGRLIEHRLGRSASYDVLTAELVAHKLIGAATAVSFVATYVSESPIDHRFNVNCDVIADGVVVAEVLTSVRVAN